MLTESDFLTDATSLLRQAGYQHRQVGGLVYSADRHTGHFRYATTVKHYTGTDSPQLPALAAGSVNLYLLRHVEGKWEMAAAPLNKPDRLIGFLMEHVEHDALAAWLRECGMEASLIDKLLGHDDAKLTHAEVQWLDALRQNDFDEATLAFLKSRHPQTPIMLVTRDMLDEEGMPDIGLITGDAWSESIIAVEDWMAAAIRETYEEARIEPARFRALLGVPQAGAARIADVKLHSRRSIECELSPVSMRLLVLHDVLDVTLQQIAHPGALHNPLPPQTDEYPASLTLAEWRNGVMAAIAQQGITPKTMAAINRFHAVLAIAQELHDPGAGACEAIAHASLPADAAKQGMQDFRLRAFQAHQ